MPVAPLETQGLTVGYSSGRKVLSDLNLTVNSGELVCLMGRNASGKSTLIKTLAGLKSPLSGTLLFSDGGNDFSKEVAVVLTEPVAVASMRVADLVAFGRYPYLDWRVALSTLDRTIIAESLNLVNVAHLSDQLVDELSDGQRQMVMIAMAIAKQTPILLLDEPTSHLDLNNRVEIMRLFRKLARETGRAIVVATHELELALQLADVLWLVTDEKSIATGIPEDMILNGTLDKIFSFEGYDLRTGRIHHENTNGLTVRLRGDTQHHRWTRNALERGGFTVSEEQGSEITIEFGSDVVWTFREHNHTTLHSLLQTLQSAQVD